MDTIRQLISHPLFDQVQDLLRERDIRLNKELLLLARHMGLATGIGNFRDLTSYATQRLYSLPMFNRRSSNDPLHLLSDPTLRLEEFFNNPLYAGGIIMSALLAPLSSEQEESIRLESMMKEINVMDSDAFFETLDFSPFFGQYEEQLHPHVKKNPKQAKTVHSVIDHWIESQKSTILYPSMSKKLLPSFTRRELDSYVNDLMEDPSVATPGFIEYLDVVEGIRVEGPSEMAQRWYTNQQKPRTYFVSGATAHHRSKFLKDFWNKLVDGLSVSNRFNRTNPRRLHYDGVKQGVFYDLTSFTSNMAVQRRFLDHLGLYCTGHRVTVMDGRHGATDVDMGELILEYNRMNWYPEYTAKILETDHGSIGYHGVGGFLGVFGNIATCTFLHASFLLQLVEHEDECSCAGDDAVAFVDDEQTIWGCVPLIGILAPEKSFSLSDIDVVYLKRRTWMDYREFRLRQKSYLQFPSFLPFMHGKELSRYREHSYSRRQIRSLAAASLQATFRSMARIFSEQGAFLDGVEIIKKYYDLLHFPLRGNIPQFAEFVGGYRDMMIPDTETLGSHDFMFLTIQNLYPGRVLLPRREDPGDSAIILKRSTMFQSTSSHFLTYLKRLGFVVEEFSPRDEYSGEDGFRRVVEEFDRDIRKPPKVTVYRIIDDVPSFIWNGEHQIVGSYYLDFSYMSRTAEDSYSDSGIRDSPPLDSDDEDVLGIDIDLM